MGLLEKAKESLRALPANTAFDLAVKYQTLLIGPHHKHSYSLDPAFDKDKFRIALTERNLLNKGFLVESPKGEIFFQKGSVGVKKDGGHLVISAPNERGLLIFLTIEKASRTLRSKVDLKKTGEVSRLLTANKEVIEVSDVRYGPIFPNAIMNLGPNEQQPLPLYKFCKKETLHKSPFSAKEKQVTSKLRRMWDFLKTCFKGARDSYRLNYQQSLKDQPALLLPLDNTVGETLGVGHVDYLGYHAEPYLAFIKDLFWEVYGTATNESQRNVAKLLLLDYSSRPPCANPIAFEGTKTLKECWPEELIKEFSEQLGTVFKWGFNNSNSLMIASNDEFCRRAAKLNGTKSTGPCGYFPDGTPFVASQFNYTVCPNGVKTSDLSDEDLLAFRNCVQHRRDNSPLKLAWAPYLPGRIGEFFSYAQALYKEEFLEHRPDYSEDLMNRMVNLISDGNFPEHDEAYRYNNGDAAINDPESGDRNLSHYRPYSKDRDARAEITNLEFSGGVLDNRLMNEWFRKNTDMADFQYVAKVRPMFPGNSPNFYATYVQLAKATLFDIEHGAAGFPSNRTVVFERYQRFYHSNNDVKVFSFDRRTAEQWITDNWSHVVRLFFGWKEFGILVNALCHCVCKSNQGIRFLSGGLLSGTPLTTLVNVVVGGCEMCYLMSKALGTGYKVICDEYFKQLKGEKEFSEINGRRILFNLGTDDQIVLYTGSEIKFSEDFLALRSLSSDQCIKRGDLITVFGLDFSVEGVEVSSFLAIYKLFLFEKARLGDEIALKYSKRFEALSKWAPLVQDLFNKHNFGSLESYSKGAKNYLDYIDRFGFDLPFEEESFSDQLILSSAFSEYDPVHDSRKYPKEVVFKLFDEFRKILNVDK